jgi:gamma-glutamylaminecyclotransferase
MRVSTYGTLKRDFPLFDKGLVGARYLGDVETVERYPLYIAGSFYGPMMLDRAGEGLHIRGELFEVEEDRLQVLDDLDDVDDKTSFPSTSKSHRSGEGYRRWRSGREDGEVA